MCLRISELRIVLAEINSNTFIFIARDPHSPSQRTKTLGFWPLSFSYHEDMQQLLKTTSFSHSSKDINFYIPVKLYLRAQCKFYIT